MTDAPAARRRGNLRWAVAFAVAVVATSILAMTLVDRLDSRPERVAWGVIAAGVVLAAVALFWVVAEAHLRWSPRGRFSRGVVGWALTLGYLALILFAAPVGLYLAIMSLGMASGW